MLSGQITCDRCGKLIVKGSLCPDCEKNPPVFNQLKSWGLYEGPLRSIVTGIKFQRKLGLIPYLIEPLSQAIIAWGPVVDWISAVPLGHQRQRERGYNQSELIARKIAVRLDIPYSDRVLTRIRETHTQVGLNAVERQQNMMDAFSADPDLCQQQSCLLIDDIATTGATLNACAKALRSAGIEKVYCFTVARTSLHPNSNPISMEVNK
jgi:ComF family protein